MTKPNLLITLTSVILLVMLGGCTSSGLDTTTPTQEDGTVVLSLDITQSRSTITTQEVESLLESSVLKIYSCTSSGSETLIRRYSPATETPSEIYLVAGDYKVTLTVGDSEPTSFDEMDRCFYGESEFEVTAKQETSAEVTASLTSRLVGVTFDDSIAELFDAGYCLYVATADNYSKDDIDNNSVPFLKYTSSTPSTGYFNLPSGVSNLVWGFYGVHTGRGEEVTLLGVIESPEEGTQSNLLFKYTEYLEVKTVTINVDQSSDDYDDSFTFAPQPTIKGDGFSLYDSHTDLSIDYGFNISSNNDISAVTLSVNGNTYIPLIEGEIQNTQSKGIVYTVGDSAKRGYLTLQPEFFALLDGGGEQIVVITAVDTAEISGTANFSILTPGISSEWVSTDLWSCTGVAELYYVDANISTSDLTAEYRDTSNNSSTWIAAQSITASAESGFYDITISPSWSRSTNSEGISIYSAVGGISPSHTYECRVKDTNGDVISSGYLTAPATTQSIPYGDIESSSLSCWTQSNSSSTSWSSGNNSFSSGLCQQGTCDGMEGNYCAYLEATEVNAIIMYTLAAGNITLGQFEMDGTSGTVRFGQPFAWSARPRSFNLKYSASLGTVDYTKYGSFLSTGTTDMARIYLAIVDWDSRHTVTSGTDKPTGVWNPATMDYIDGCGAIIGFALLDITQSTSSTMQDVEIPIYYYDYNTKPSGKYTLVISAATCAYGDYMNGSTTSKMWIDNLHFGY